jgi:hypothetical protein
LIVNVAVPAGTVPLADRVTPFREAVTVYVLPEILVHSENTSPEPNPLAEPWVCPAGIIRVVDVRKVSYPY